MIRPGQMPPFLHAGKTPPRPIGPEGPKPGSACADIACPVAADREMPLVVASRQSPATMPCRAPRPCERTFIDPHPLSSSPKFMLGKTHAQAWQAVEKLFRTSTKGARGAGRLCDHPVSVSPFFGQAAIHPPIGALNRAFPQPYRSALLLDNWHADHGSRHVTSQPSR